MTLTNIHLTEEQRQQLLDLLHKRFKKMNDRALLELERLTRHPGDLTGFQAVPKQLVVTKPELVQPRNTDSNQVIDGVFSTPINRREFMAYAASGLISLILGYGWWKSNTNADNLSGTLDEVGLGINHLGQTTVELQRVIYSLREVMADFQSTYQPTLNAIAQLNQQINKLYGQYQQLDEIGKAIADLMQLASRYATLIPEVERYAQPINTMVEMVKENTPSTISAAEEAIAKLNFWFSNEGDQGINNRLLMPTDSVFQMIENEIKTDIEAIRTKLD
jgi:hypothetical protein